MRALLNMSASTLFLLFKESKLEIEYMPPKLTETATLRTLPRYWNSSLALLGVLHVNLAVITKGSLRG